jgi:TonB family protein
VRGIGVWLAIAVMGAATVVVTEVPILRAQEGDGEIARHVKSKVQPEYPALARKMNLAGIVKVRVVVSPNGIVTQAKVVGGHPLLASAAIDAVRKWRFEPAATESTGIVDFKFEPHQ